jgi:hypothetical protein
MLRTRSSGSVMKGACAAGRATRALRSPRVWQVQPRSAAQRCNRAAPGVVAAAWRCGKRNLHRLGSPYLAVQGSVCWHAHRGLAQRASTGCRKQPAVVAHRRASRGLCRLVIDLAPCSTGRASQLRRRAGDQHRQAFGTDLQSAHAQPECPDLKKRKTAASTAPRASLAPPAEALGAAVDPTPQRDRETVVRLSTKARPRGRTLPAASGRSWKAGKPLQCQSTGRPVPASTRPRATRAFHTRPCRRAQKNKWRPRAARLPICTPRARRLQAGQLLQASERPGRWPFVISQTSSAQRPACTPYTPWAW